MVELLEGPDFNLIKERVARNEEGSFTVIELQTGQIEFTFPDPELLRQDLNLIYGIGPATAFRLKQEGYQTIADLVGHPRWQKAALEIIRAIKMKDLGRLARYGASDFQLLSFFTPEEICFIDIETVGLYYIHPVFLVGTLQFNRGHGSIRQFLARDYGEERAILRETFVELKKVATIISYNGRSFDLPYLKGRLRFHQMTEEVNSIHVDLLKQSRRSYRKILPNCKLLTLERHLLDQERIDDIPGAEIGEFYHRFIDTGNTEYIKPILEHNAWDLLTMAKILGFLTARRSEKVVENGD